MAYTRRKVSSRTYAKKRTVSRRSYAPKRKMTAVKRIVKREIARNVENKHRDVLVGAGSGVAGRELVSATNTTFFDDNNVIKLTPAATDAAWPALVIQQGTGSSNRIGDRIKIKKMMFRGTIIQSTYDSIKYPVVKPTQVKMFLFYNRQQPSLKPAVQANSDFFQFNNSAQIIEDDLISMWAPVNEDKYRVLKTKIFKVGRQTSAQFSTGTTGPVNLASNDFQLNCNFSIDVTKYMPKEVRFRDNDADPSSRGLYAMFVPVAADGTAFGSGSFPCNLTYNLSCTFEDA